MVKIDHGGCSQRQLSDTQKILFFVTQKVFFFCNTKNTYIEFCPNRNVKVNKMSLYKMCIEVENIVLSMTTDKAR